MFKGIPLLFLWIGLLFLAGCGGRDAGDTLFVRREALAFDTIVSIKAYGENAGPALDEIMEFMARVDALMNRYDPGSDISRINARAGEAPVAVDPLTFELIEEALVFCAMTGGALDITAGGLVDLWQAFREEPPGVQVAAAKAAVDYTGVMLDPEKKTVFLSNPRAAMDLGAVTKGFFARKGLAILQGHGVESALIMAGGNIYALGRKPDGKPWTVGIRNPQNTDAIITSLYLEDGAVDTAGSYARKDHIFDPFTGYPARGFVSVTVVADDPLEADALSTAAFVMGPDRGPAFLAGKDIVAYLITEKGEVMTTAGFACYQAKNPGRDDGNGG